MSEIGNERIIVEAIAERDRVLSEDFSPIASLIGALRATANAIGRGELSPADLDEALCIVRSYSRMMIKVNKVSSPQGETNGD